MPSHGVAGRSVRGCAIEGMYLPWRDLSERRALCVCALGWGLARTSHALLLARWRRRAARRLLEACAAREMPIALPSHAIKPRLNHAAAINRGCGGCYRRVAFELYRIDLGPV